MLFIPKLVGKPGQADEIIEFVKSDSKLAETVNQDYVTLREVERPKFLPSQIVRMMKEEGFPGFTMHWHTHLWNSLDAKNPGKGYGVVVGANAWFWYSSWVEVVRQHCNENGSRFG